MDEFCKINFVRKKKVNCKEKVNLNVVLCIFTLHTCYTCTLYREGFTQSSLCNVKVYLIEKFFFFMKNIENFKTELEVPICCIFVCANCVYFIWFNGLVFDRKVNIFTLSMVMYSAMFYGRYLPNACLDL